MRGKTANKKNQKTLPHTAEQLAMLNDIGRAMTALGEMDSVLNAIREQAHRILAFDAFIILLYSPETSIVSYPLVYDNGRNWTEPDRPLALDMRSHAVIKSGKPALVNLTKKEFEEALKDQSRSLTGDYSQNYRSFLYAPLLRQGRAIGVVSAVSYQFNAYTQEQLGLLESVATQATIAIENARLYQAQQKEIAERKQAQEEIRKLNAELEQRVERRTLQLQEANENLKIEKARLERYNRQREILARLTDLLQASQNKDEASEIVSKQLKLLSQIWTARCI